MKSTNQAPKTPETQPQYYPPKNDTFKTTVDTKVSKLDQKSKDNRACMFTKYLT